MPAVATRIVSVLTVWGVSAALLRWGRLPDHVRRAAALLTSVAGLVALVLALNTQGQREAPTTAEFLLTTGYVTGHVSASASLRYYVATAVCLLAGTVGLAVADPVARRLDDRWLAAAIALSLAITVLRFALEKVAAPRTWTFAVGITWLAPLMGALFLERLRASGQGLRALVRALLSYALAARGFVAALMIVASSLRLGSHYDVTAFTAVRIGDTVHRFAPGSLTQVLLLGVVPQLTFWVGYTVIAGLVGAAVFAGVSRAGEGLTRGHGGVSGRG